MVETTVDIRFSADAEACVMLESSASGDVEQQAELVCFGHYAARIIVLLGQEESLPLIRSLALLDRKSTVDGASFVDGDRQAFEDIIDPRVRVVPPDPSFPVDRSAHVLARFVGTRRGPRMLFSLKSRNLRVPAGEGADHASASVHLLLDALLKRRTSDEQYLRRLATTAGLVGRLAIDARITTDNEFDVALACADVAWRADPRTAGDAGSGEGDAELKCPVCGKRGSSSPSDQAFEFRLWPSDRDAIRKCTRCGAGLWLRAHRRAHPISPDVWAAMEAIRAGLASEFAAPVGDPRERAEGDGSGVYQDLKRVFLENRWPFIEVRGAPVLLSELSGPLGVWKFYAQVVEEQGLVLLCSICPLRVPEERRLEVAKFLTLANYGLAAGNFELDFEDGEIRYKTPLHVEGELRAATVKRVVRANGIAMETYLPGIGAVIVGTPAALALERRTIG